MLGHKEQVKTVFLSVHDMVGNELANNTEQGDIAVVSIVYKYDDEDDDTCTIKLQMTNPKSLDRLSIHRGTKLQVLWGYKGGLLSPITTVVVRDMTSKYGDNIIYTDLECSDYLAYLKISRSPDVGKGSIIDFIKAQVYGRYSIVIKDRGHKVYVQIRKGEEEKETNVEINKGESSYYAPWLKKPIFDPLKEDDNFDTSKTLPSKPSPTISSTGEWVSSSDNSIRKYLEDENTDIPTSNRSIFVVLQDLFKKAPNGPWFITGRGHTLYIHNRNLGKGIYREYKYGEIDSNLIDFTAKTKFDNFDKQVISYAGMDPSDRKNFFVDDYRQAIKVQRTPKEILEDKKITTEEKEKQVRDYLNLRLQGYSNFGAIKTEGSFVPNYKGGYVFIPGHLDKPYRKSLLAQEVAVPDNTSFANIDGFVRNNDGDQFDPNIHDVVLRANWYTFPLLSQAEAVNVTNNRQRELAMDKEEATVILEGDPWIKSETTIRVTNVHTQHEGNYYIKKCEHSITTNGYKTQLTCIKVIPETMINTITQYTKENYDSLSDDIKNVLDEQVKREQVLFGSDIIVKYQSIENSGKSNTISETGSIKQGEVKYSNFWDDEGNFSMDEYIDAVLKASSKKGAVITSNTETR